MHQVLLALKSYLYGGVWLLIAILVAILGYRLLDHYSPIDLTHEIRQQNIAASLVVGLFLLGLVFGTLYLAAHIS